LQEALRVGASSSGSDCCGDHAVQPMYTVFNGDPFHPPSIDAEPALFRRFVPGARRQRQARLPFSVSQRYAEMRERIAYFVRAMRPPACPSIYFRRLRRSTAIEWKIAGTITALRPLPAEPGPYRRFLCLPAHAEGIRGEMQRRLLTRPRSRRFPHALVGKLWRLSHNGWR